MHFSTAGILKNKEGEKGTVKFSFRDIEKIKRSVINI